MTKRDIATIKEVCNVEGYSGVLKALVEIALENHKADWHREFVVRSHKKHIKNLRKCLRKIERTNREVEAFLHPDCQ